MIEFLATESMNRVNYSKEAEKIIDRVRSEGSTPRLLLHSCCAPCSSYVMEYLREYFALTVFYYNPNITESGEYEKRLEEEKRLISEYNRQVDEGTFEKEGMHSTAAAHKIEILEAPYDPKEFLEAVRGLENCAEGGERCFICYEQRLRKTAEMAKAGNFDFFTTTLTISPLKNAAKLNEIGLKLAGEYGVQCFPSDFKKKDGYKRSIELSALFGLYRQNYCGCVFSRRDAQKREQEKHSET